MSNVNVASTKRGNSKMAEEAVTISSQQTKPIKILKWKIRDGITVSVGRIILLYEVVGENKPEQKKLKAIRAGTIDKIIVPEGSTVQPGERLYTIKSCSHPTIMNDMCAECGADLRKEETSAIASVPMIHSIPDLKVSEEQAQKLGRADSERLIKDRKLVLLVDLDQTLIHTTNDNIPPNIKDVYHFQLYGPNSPWYHTRLRPGTHKFLNSIYDFFELHICTFGARNYAHTIAMFLDPDQKFFSNRILSRDECFDPTSKKANLTALFPCGDDMVCIIDDREDVWNHASNLIHVKPYHFFQHTGDINAPPGLDKHENDDKAGVDLTKIANDVEKEKEGNSDVEKEKETKSSSQNGDGQNKDDVEIKEEEANVKSEENEEKETGGLTNGNKPTEPSENSKGTNKLEPTDKEEKDCDEDEASPEESTNEKSDETAEIIEETPNGKLKNTDTTDDPKEEVEPPVDPEFTPKVKYNKEENLIEIEDPDDYLIYLEEVLLRIHSTYYEEYDKLEAGYIPDLKTIIPLVRSSVLKGCKLVFSGLVPNHIKLETSKAYQVARSLGAVVTQDLEEDTTHIVAVRPGTAKVNAGRRRKNLKIVTPDWLWSCVERWEHVDERIFPLNSKGSKNRHPPPHCSSPEHITVYPEHSSPAMRKRTPSGRFMDTINPLMSFSSDDIADMDKEVEDILEDDESDDDGEEETYDSEAKRILDSNMLNEEKEESSSSSSEGMNYDAGDYPKGYKRKREDVIENAEDIDDLDREVNDSAEEEEESPSVKFRRGESIEDELDIDRDEDDSPDGSESSFEPPDQDEMDDGEWNMMGAALEREFLSE